MKPEHIEKMANQIDVMIATITQNAVLHGSTPKLDEARELLKDARLKLIEEYERLATPQPQLHYSDEHDLACEEILESEEEYAEKWEKRIQ